MTALPFVEIADGWDCTHDAKEDYPRYQYGELVENGDKRLSPDGYIETVAIPQKVSIAKTVLPGDIITFLYRVFRVKTVIDNFINTPDDYVTWDITFDEMKGLNDGDSITRHGVTYTRNGNIIEKDDGVIWEQYSNIFHRKPDGTLEALYITMSDIYGSIDSDYPNEYKDGGLYSYIRLSRVFDDDEIVPPDTAESLIFINTLQPTNQNRAFDDKSYTTTSYPHEIKFWDVKPASGAYIAVILSGLIGEHVKVTIGDYVQERDIIVTPDGETAIFYTEGMVPTTEPCEIEVTRSDYGEAGIGTIGLSAELIDFGVTHNELQMTLDDNSPFEEKKGGYIDYIPGVALYKGTIKTTAYMSDFHNLLVAIKKIKKTRIGYDLGDSWNIYDETTRAVQMVGRLDTVTVRTSDNSGTLSEIFDIEISIGEAS